MKGLLASPARTSLLLSGLGLLGSKTQNQADKYFNLGAQGLLNHAQGVQDQKKLEEQRAYEESQKIIKGADGYNYRPSGERVLPDVVANTAQNPTTLMQNLSAAGVDLNSPEGQKIMLEKIMQSNGTTINNIPSPPVGYSNVYNPDGTLKGQEIIPGGPADQKRVQQEIENSRKEAEFKAEQEAAAKAAEEAKAQALKKDQAVLAGIDNTIRNIDLASEEADFNSTGLVGKMFSGIPGTDAYNLARDVETVKANIGFDKLQLMRDLSPTGGALGQVAVQELNALQNSIAALEPGTGSDKLKEGLDAVKLHYTRWKATLEMQDHPEAAGFGGLTEKGLEVFNANGELIGHFQ